MWLHWLPPSPDEYLHFACKLLHCPLFLGVGAKMLLTGVDGWWQFDRLMTGWQVSMVDGRLTGVRIWNKSVLFRHGSSTKHHQPFKCVQQQPPLSHPSLLFFFLFTFFHIILTRCSSLLFICLSDCLFIFVFGNSLCIPPLKEFLRIVSKPLQDFLREKCFRLDKVSDRFEGWSECIVGHAQIIRFLEQGQRVGGKVEARQRFDKGKYHWKWEEKGGWEFLGRWRKEGEGREDWRKNATGEER